MSKVSVSILSNELNAQYIIDNVNRSNADYLHLDIMDGKFVSNKTWNIKEIQKLLKNNKKNVKVHLMVSNVIKFINDYSLLNVNTIIFHYEAVKDVLNVINLIHSYGIKAGLSIKPSTSVKDIYNYLDYLDEVLIMSVEPGASGQEFIENTYDKIKDLKGEIKRNNLNTFISVDGGINDITGKKCIESGADILVSASFIHKNIQENINVLKKLD